MSSSDEAGSGPEPDTGYYDEIQRLKRENEKIPRRLRTHNMRYRAEYCSHWTTSDGLREILQNFFDGMCRSFHCTHQDITFTHKEQGGPHRRQWVETWVAYHKNEPTGQELGHIRFNRKNHTILIENEYATLTEEVLLMGASDKRNNSNFIGEHGEGMKVGILRLVAHGQHKVTYRTGGMSWKFYMKQERGCPFETLFYRTSDINPSNKTVVEITNISDLSFRIDDYLALCDRRLSRVSYSRCPEGFLLSARNKQDERKFNQRIYLKGIFVCSEPRLHFPINLLMCKLDRDRKLLAENHRLCIAIADIWGATIRREATQVTQPLTKRFIDLVKNEGETSLEYSCLQYMDKKVASTVYKYIVREKPGAFPCDIGGQDFEVIKGVLNREPYPCPSGLLTLLQRAPECVTVSEAKEKKFKEASTATEEMCNSPSLHFTELLRALAAKMTPDKDVNFKISDEFQVLAIEKLVLVSETFVCVAKTTDAVMKAVHKFTKEIVKDLKASERAAAEVIMLKFLITDEFRALLNRTLGTHRRDPDKDKRRNPDRRHDDDNDDDDDNDGDSSDNEDDVIPDNKYERRSQMTHNSRKSWTLRRRHHAALDRANAKMARLDATREPADKQTVSLKTFTRVTTDDLQVDNSGRKDHGICVESIAKRIQKVQGPPQVEGWQPSSAMYQLGSVHAENESDRRRDEKHSHAGPDSPQAESDRPLKHNRLSRCSSGEVMMVDTADSDKENRQPPTNSTKEEQDDNLRNSQSEQQLEPDSSPTGAESTANPVVTRSPVVIAKDTGSNVGNTATLVDAAPRLLSNPVKGLEVKVEPSVFVCDVAASTEGAATEKAQLPSSQGEHDDVDLTERDKPVDDSMDKVRNEQDNAGDGHSSNVTASTTAEKTKHNAEVDRVDVEVAEQDVEQDVKQDDNALKDESESRQHVAISQFIGPNDVAETGGESGDTSRAVPHPSRDVDMNQSKLVSSLSPMKTSKGDEVKDDMAAGQIEASSDVKEGKGDDRGTAIASNVGPSSASSGGIVNGSQAPDEIATPSGAFESVRMETACDSDIDVAQQNMKDNDRQGDKENKDMDMELVPDESSQAGQVATFEKESTNVHPVDAGIKVPNAASSGNSNAASDGRTARLNEGNPIKSSFGQQWDEKDPENDSDKQKPATGATNEKTDIDVSENVEDQSMENQPMDMGIADHNGSDVGNTSGVRSVEGITDDMRLAAQFKIGTNDNEMGSIVDEVRVDKELAGQKSVGSDQDADQHEVILTGQKDTEIEGASAADEAAVNSKENAGVMLSERVGDAEVSILQDVNTKGSEQGIAKKDVEKSVDQNNTDDFVDMAAQDVEITKSDGMDVDVRISSDDVTSESESCHAAQASHLPKLFSAVGAPAGDKAGPDAPDEDSSIKPVSSLPCISSEPTVNEEGDVARKTGLSCQSTALDAKTCQNDAGSNDESNALGTCGNAEQQTESMIEKSSDTVEVKVNITPASAASNEDVTSTPIITGSGTTDTVKNAAKHDESTASQFCDAESAGEMKTFTHGSKVEAVGSSKVAQEEPRDETHDETRGKTHGKTHDDTYDRAHDEVKTDVSNLNKRAAKQTEVSEEKEISSKAAEVESEDSKHDDGAEADGQSDTKNGGNADKPTEQILDQGTCQRDIGVGNTKAPTPRAVENADDSVKKLEVEGCDEVAIQTSTESTDREPQTKAVESKKAEASEFHVAAQSAGGVENVDPDGNDVVVDGTDEKLSQDVEVDGVYTMIDVDATASVRMDVEDEAGTHAQESTQHNSDTHAAIPSIEVEIDHGQQGIHDPLQANDTTSKGIVGVPEEDGDGLKPVEEVVLEKATPCHSVAESEPEPVKYQISDGGRSDFVNDADGTGDGAALAVTEPAKSQPLMPSAAGITTSPSLVPSSSGNHPSDTTPACGHHGGRQSQDLEAFEIRVQGVGTITVLSTTKGVVRKSFGRAALGLYHAGVDEVTASTVRLREPSTWVATLGNITGDGGDTSSAEQQSTLSLCVSVVEEEVVVVDKSFFGGASNCTTSDEADNGGNHKRTIGAVLQQQEEMGVRHDRFDSPPAKRVRRFEDSIAEGSCDTSSVDLAGLVGGEDRTATVVKSEMMLESADVVQPPQNVQPVKCMHVVTILFGKYSVGVCLPGAAGDGFTHHVEKASFVAEQASAVAVTDCVDVGMESFVARKVTAGDSEKEVYRLGVSNTDWC